MEEELVSVNITTFNRAHLLPRCIDSILSQTYKNIEIIIADDASYDNTREVVQEYQKKDNRIQYFFHKENKGNAETRNTALQNCHGTYVAFMDDDDEWIDTKKIEKQVAILNKSLTEIDIVCTGIILIDENDNKTKKVVKPPSDLKAHILARNGIIYSPTVMVRKKLLERTEGFDTNLSRGIDSDFYRNCILEFDSNVHFMPDITTAIHEYGDDRITPSVNRNDKFNIIRAHTYTLKKYFIFFLRYPKSLIFRIWIISKNLIKLINING